MSKNYHSIVAALATKLAVAVVFGALWAGYCQAEAVTDWRTYKASPATSLAGQGTDDPILGAIGTTGQAAFTLGYLTTPAILGPNEGDFVTFTFGVAFNDAVGAPANGLGDNFRFALFDLNGEEKDSATGDGSGGPNYATAGTANTDNFRGYWFGNKGGGGAGNNGSIREREVALTGGVTNAFANAAPNGAMSLGPVGGDNVPLVFDVNGDGSGNDYIGEMTLTRTAGGLIDLTGILKNAATLVGNEFAASDTTGATLPSTFGAVGFLNGGGLNCDQVLFTDVDVSAGSAPIEQVGDHNDDGIVDAADYVAWRKLDEGNAQGYDDFVEHFGEGGGGGGSQQAATGVPEPTLMGFVASAAMILLGFARSRRNELTRVLARQVA